jgi:hypothetical protein
MNRFKVGKKQHVDKFEVPDAGRYNPNYNAVYK